MSRRECDKRYKLKHKEEVSAYAQNYHLQHKEDINLKKKEYYALKKKEINEKHKEYYMLNKKKTNERYNNRKETDPFFKLAVNMRSRVTMAFKRIKKGKPTTTESLLGANYKIVAKHIESQFSEGMSWEKLGKEIHIDHVVPLASAKDIDELIALCHYSNLQPLWAIDNFKKGSKLETIAKRNS